jgi:molecular chaperone GrpE (heat shock protein)
MSEETKAKIKASREANKANKVPGEKRATLDDQIAAAQALADSGDAFATSLMPVVDVLREAMLQAKADAKANARKLRKTLSVLK